MNLEIANTQNNFGTGALGIISKSSFNFDERPISETSVEDYETYSQNVLSEISRIKNISDDDARKFIDYSSFDEIVQCLREGSSSLGSLDPRTLAMTFCNISTS